VIVFAAVAPHGDLDLDPALRAATGRGDGTAPGPPRAHRLWQLLVLQGAVGEGAPTTVLAHAAPTYYGMAVAEVSA
jgi:hypothetical protein